MSSAEALASLQAEMAALVAHTKGKLRVDPDDRPGMEYNNHLVSVDEPNFTICFMAHDGTRDNLEGEANTARLVACWNACEHYSTEQLQDHVIIGPAATEWGRKIIADHDALRKKLKEIAMTKDEYVFWGTIAIFAVTLFFVGW